MAELKRKAMSPQNAASMRSRIEPWMDRPWRCWRVAGAKISMSRWKSSHQKGAESLIESEDVVETTMARMSAAWRLEKAERFRDRASLRHVVRKSGGSCR